MTGAIVQARMSSTRLPGKVMLEAAGKPLLGHLWERLTYCRELDTVLIATTDNPADDVIEDYCNRVAIPVFRGHEQDVLDRYYQAAKQFGLNVVIRVTSDSPLVDPGLIDSTIRFFDEHRSEYDLVTNRHPITHADGLDFDVMTLAALEYVWRHATAKHQREHTVPYFWESGMRVFNVEDPQQLVRQHRWCLDYQEDYCLIKAIVDALYDRTRYFTTENILSYLAHHPELATLNSRYMDHNN
ncbi:MAG: glycosyltransferase family protein [Acidobacteriaceae bacterium]|nr:glycosyltransferase family protein [Acidobacteriaceae bacterium]